MSSDNYRKDYEAGVLDTTDGAPPHRYTPGAPGPIDPATGQHTQYWVLSEAERAKGFIRPVRRSYVHRHCGVTTTMGLALAETYAREPHFYGSTFCVRCRAHYPVDEFTWAGTDEQLGS